MTDHRMSIALTGRVGIGTVDTMIGATGTGTVRRVVMIAAAAAIGIATTDVVRTNVIGGTIATTTATEMSRSSCLRVGNKKARPREARRRASRQLTLAAGRSPRERVVQTFGLFRATGCFVFFELSHPEALI